MKKISLVFDNLRHFFLRNKLIFTLYVLGNIVCVIAFIYFMGNMTSYKTQNAKNAIELRTYKINLSVPENPKSDKLNKLKSDLTESIDLRCNLSIKSIQFDNISETFGELVKQEPILLCTSMQNNSSIYAEQGRVHFTESEIKQAKNVIIVPSSLLADSPKLRSNSELILNGTPFQAIGTSTEFLSFYIPSTTYQRLGFTVSSVKIIFKHPLSRYEEDQFYDNVGSLLKIQKITGPDSFKNALKSNTIHEMYLIGLIYIVSLLAFMFLIKYMIDCFQRELTVYALAGASGGQISMLLSLQVTIISFFSSAVAILIHVVLYRNFFSQINVLEHITYHWYDYLFVLILAVLLSNVAAWPFLLSCRRSTVMRLKRRYE